MKKIALAVATSAALIAGPVAVAGPAAADNCDPRYQRCPVPENHVEPVKKVIKEGQTPKIIVAVERVGNRAPVGKLVIRIIKPNGKVKKIKIPNFMAGESDLVRLPELKGGSSDRGKQYEIRTTFVPKNDRFAISKDRTNIRVKNHKR